MKIFFVQQGILPCLQVQNRRILDGMKNTAGKRNALTAIFHLLTDAPQSPKKLTGADVAKLAERYGVRLAVAYILASKAL
jgi:hypothetical protein